MTWSFSASGTKEECQARLEAGKPPEDAANAHQFEVAMAVIKDELTHYGDGSKEMSISASGHAPGNDGGDRSFSLWISGKAHPPTAKAVVRPQAEASVPSTDKRRR